MLVNTLNRCLFLLVRTFVNIAPVNPSRWHVKLHRWRKSWKSRQQHGMKSLEELLSLHGLWQATSSPPIFSRSQGWSTLLLPRKPSTFLIQLAFWRVVSHASSQHHNSVSNTSGSCRTDRIQKKSQAIYIMLTYHVGICFFDIYHQDIIHQLNIVITTN